MSADVPFVVSVFLLGAASGGLLASVWHTAVQRSIATSSPPSFNAPSSKSVGSALHGTQRQKSAAAVQMLIDMECKKKIRNTRPSPRQCTPVVPL